MEAAAAGFTLDSRPFLSVEQTVFRQHVFCIRFLTPCWPLEGLGRGTQNIIFWLEILALALLKQQEISMSVSRICVFYFNNGKSQHLQSGGQSGGGSPAVAIIH